jgi:hypothetical protein
MLRSLRSELEARLNLAREVSLAAKYQAVIRAVQVCMGQAEDRRVEIVEGPVGEFERIALRFW